MDLIIKVRITIPESTVNMIITDEDLEPATEREDMAAVEELVERYIAAQPSRFRTC